MSSNFICHSRSNTGPVLFSFRSKAFFGKKKASVRAEDSDWSDKFALDVVGSNGIVTCRSRNVSSGVERIYQLNVSITLSANALTKVSQLNVSITLSANALTKVSQLNVSITLSANALTKVSQLNVSITLSANAITKVRTIEIYSAILIL